MSNKDRIEQNNLKINSNTEKIQAVTTTVNTLSGLTKNEYNACLTLTSSIDNIEDYTDTSATAEDIREGKTAYSNGEKIVGTLTSGNSNMVTTELHGGDVNKKISPLYEYIRRIDEPLVLASNATAQHMFQGCTALEYVELDLVNSSRLDYAFYGCGNLQNVKIKDNNKLTLASYAFYGCENLKEIPQLDFSKCTNLTYLFGNCKSLTTVPQIDASKSTNIQRMFTGCEKLISVSLVNTSLVTTIEGVFSNCKALTKIPQFDTSKATKSQNFCYNCINLVDVPQFNLASIKLQNGSTNYDCGQMFTNCINLSDESLNNIMASLLTLPSATTESTKRLSYIGFSEEQATRCQTLSNWEALVSNGWTTGF